MLEAYVGVDVGTSGCKAVLIDKVGRVRASAWNGYEPFYGIDGEVSQDAEDWLAATAAVLRSLATSARESGLTIEAIAATAPAHTMVLLGKDAHPVARAILPYDTRSASVAERLSTVYGSPFFDRTFVRLGPSWTLPQLVWLQEASPEVWSRVHMALITKDFVSFSLTGARSTDPSDAAGTGLYDQRAGCWAEDICSEVGLRVEQLPPIAAATDTVGRLTSSWAVRTGIPAGTPVAVSATDTACELLSLSITKPGDGLIKIASTGTVVTVLKEPRPDPRILTYPYLEGNWYTVAATNAAATAYRWLQETVFDAVSGSPSATYAEMDQIASTVPAGSDGVLFLPFLTGERSPYWDSDLRAAFLGVSAGHRRPHLCRAVLEGVAFSLRDCRDLLAGLGIPVRQPYFAGGGVASQLWREILASVLKTSGTLAAPQGPALGAAMLAAACVTGTVPLIERAKETVEPDPAWVTIYDRLHPIYRDAARCLTDINHSLVRAQLR